MSCVTYYTETSPLPITTSTIRNNCMGIGLTLSEQKAYWNNVGNTHTSCQTYYNNLIYSGPNRTYSEEGFNQASADLTYIFSTFYNNSLGNEKGGHKITSPGDPGYDSFQDTLIGACSNNPAFHLEGVCQIVAQQMCNKCNATDISSNRSLLRLCGCQVNSLTGTSSTQGIPQECDPLCAQEQVSKKRNPTTGVVKNCDATVCVINSISINASESLVGGVSFTQVCPQCEGNNQCRCIVDSSIPELYEGTGINVAFNQYCGANSVCFTIDPATGQSTITECNTSMNNLQPIEYKVSIPKWVWIVSAIIIILSIIVLLACIYISDHSKVITREEISKQQFNAQKKKSSGTALDFNRKLNPNISSTNFQRLT